MTWPELLRLLKEMTGTEHSKIPDAKFYRWLTDAHKEIANSLNAYIDNKYFYGKYTTDLIAWQNRYDNFPVNVYDAVNIKYDPNSEFGKKWVPIDMQEQKETPEYYAVNQNIEHPRYEVIWGDSVIIYPTPKKDVTAGLQVIWKTWVWVINENSGLNDILLWKISDYHNLIALRAEQYVFQYTDNRTKRLDAKQEYIEELDRIITELSKTGEQPLEIEESDYSDYL